MNDGTKKRTLLRALTTAGVVVAVWNYVFESTLNALGEVWMAAVVATIVSLAVVAVDAYTTYKNQDYSEAGDIGTNVTRMLKKDPTLIVDMREGGEEDEDDEVEEGEDNDDSEDAED